MSAILNHLWQATVIAAGASLLGLALGRYRPAVRFRVWLVASLQFLFPLGLLVSLGGLLHRSYPAAATASLPAMQIGAPSLPAIQIGAALVVPASSAAISVPSAGGGAIWPALLLGVWACGAVVVFVVWLREWCRIRALVHRAFPLDLGLPVRTVSGPARIELGVFGVLRPGLFVPEGLPESLSPGQLRAVLAHELCHVRRRDNLWAALHALVQAAFWFHPLVWWLGGRMTRDRELACDEGAVRLGASADEYAHGLLKICAAYTTAPAACMSGVSGADLKQRVLWIANGTLAPALGKRMRWMLALCAALAVAAPLVAGVLLSPAQTPAPKFAVVSIKPDAPGLSTNLNYHFVLEPDGSTSSEDTVLNLLEVLLADRFQLVIHHETKRMAVYELVPVKGGAKFPPPSPPGQPPPIVGTIQNPKHPDWVTSPDPGEVAWGISGLYGLVGMLEQELGRPIIDKTGITGDYNIHLIYQPGPGAPNAAFVKPAPAGANYPSLFEVLKEQLGLQLRPAKDPVDIIVIDHLARPTPN